MYACKITLGDGPANPDEPAFLDTHHIYEWVRREDPDECNEARRTFYREVNLNPFKRHPHEELRMVEWLFWDWLAFDWRTEDGLSPYRRIARTLHDNDAGLDDQDWLDVQETDDTQFLSMFWIKEADAAKGRLVLEDIADEGREYLIPIPQYAARYDGARGGTVITRIARVRGAWRPFSMRLYESRRPDTPHAREVLIDSFRHYHPDAAGWVRFLYGRAKDTGLDWEDMEALVHGRPDWRQVVQRMVDEHRPQYAYCPDPSEYMDPTDFIDYEMHGGHGDRRPGRRYLDCIDVVGCVDVPDYPDGLEDVSGPGRSDASSCRRGSGFLDYPDLPDLPDVTAGDGDGDDGR